MLTWSQRIFISYRRAEASDLVGRLHDRLVTRTRHKVFLDVDMSGGTTYPDAITKALRDCDALIAVIGPRWLDARDAQGRRRLDDPQDLVRVEVETALRRGVRLVPVLVNGAVMPDESDLPAPMAELARRQALRLRSDTFPFDFGRILTAVEPPSKPPHMRALAAVAGSLLLVAAAGVAVTVPTSTGNLVVMVSDAAVAAALAVLGIWAALDRWRRPVAAGVLLGVAPFVLLKIWRSAVVRGVPVSGSSVPLLAVTAAVVLVLLLLTIDPDAGLRYERPRGDAARTVVPLGALACVALAAIGSTLPASVADLGSLRFSDPLVLLSAAALALLTTCSRGALRGSVLIGWAAGAAAVLANTIWLRSYSGFTLPPVTDAHLLMSALTVAVLGSAAVLAFRERPRSAMG